MKFLERLFGNSLVGLAILGGAVIVLIILLNNFSKSRQQIALNKQISDARARIDAAQARGERGDDRDFELAGIGPIYEQQDARQ